MSLRYRFAGLGFSDCDDGTLRWPCGLIVRRDHNVKFVRGLRVKLGR